MNNFQRILLFGLLIILGGCTGLNNTIKHTELADNKVVSVSTKEFSTTLFTKIVNTKGYKNLRVFTHIFNEDYATKPIPNDAYFEVIAYYAIGQGSWGYHSERFNYRSTSGWAGVANIPIVGEITRVGIYASRMPGIKLKVDVVASFH